MTSANTQQAQDVAGTLPVSDAALPVLVVLVVAALALGRALAAVVAAVLALLVPALALLRSLLVVVGLIVALGLGMANGSGEQPAPDEPRDTGPSPTAVQPRPDPRASTRAPRPRTPPSTPRANRSPGAPGR